MNTTGSRTAVTSVKDELLDLYHQLARIREFEERVETLNRTGKLPGFVHTAVGQEAVAVGVCKALGPHDYVTTGHRGHGHYLAKGGDTTALMAELFGRETGLNRGRAGSMHFVDFSVNMLGANGIIGGQLGIAVGAALSAKLQGESRVAAAFFGEGAVPNASFHESLNLASVLSVPAVFVCENNLYAHETPVEKIIPGAGIADRAATYGVSSYVIDGNDVIEVLEVSTEAIEHCRQEQRPVLLEAKTYRHVGHHAGDRGRHYRPEEELKRWLARDPLVMLSGRIATAGGTEEEINAMSQRARQEIDVAVSTAERAALPEADEAFTYVTMDGEQ